MAENTCLKDLHGEIRGQAEDIKKLMELLKLHREKGLCCFCDDEKLSFNHKCNNSTFMFLQLDESFIEVDKDFPNIGRSVTIEEPIIEDYHLSLNALKDVTSGSYSNASSFASY